MAHDMSYMKRRNSVFRLCSAGTPTHGLYIRLFDICLFTSPPQNHLLHISLIAPAIHFQCHIVYPAVCATDNILTPTVIFKLQYYCNCNCYSFAVTIQCVMWGPTVNTQRLYRCWHLIAFPCCLSCVEGLMMEQSVSQSETCSRFIWDRQFCCTQNCTVLSPSSDTNPQNQPSHTARQQIIRPSKQHKLESFIRTARFMDLHSATFPPFISACQQSFFTLTIVCPPALLGPVSCCSDDRLHVQPQAPTPLHTNNKLNFDCICTVHVVRSLNC